MPLKPQFKLSISIFIGFLVLLFVIATNAQNTNQHKPVANAGDNQFAHLNTMIKLNASNSTDIDGNRLEYQWQIVAKPAFSQAKLTDANKVTPLLNIDKAGVYQVELLVSDGVYNSTSVVAINTEQTTPILPNLHNQKTLKYQDAYLSADKAYDPDGDYLRL